MHGGRQISESELSESDLAAGMKYGMSRIESVEACRLFHKRFAGCPTDAEHRALTFNDVDLLLRHLRIFMPMRELWALFYEIDENLNSTVEIEEFVNMVAKLRGRSPMTGDFHVRSLPRAIKEKWSDWFEMIKDADGLIDRDEMIAASKELNPHVNTNSAGFRQTLETLNETDGKFGCNDFLVCQAKLRKKTPEIDIALLSLTEDEHTRFAQLFNQWRENSHNNASPQEMKVVLQQIGFHLSVHQCRDRLASVELDGSRAIKLNEFLFILINMGAGSSESPRNILCPGASYEEAFKLGFSLEELWELGYDDPAQARGAGWSVHEVVKAGIAETWELRQVGYTAGELRKVGLSAKNLKLAGFSLEDLRNAGFSSAVLRDCTTNLSRSRPQTADKKGLALRPLTMSDGVTAPALGTVFETGSPSGEERWWGTPRIQTMLETSRVNESLVAT